MTGKQARRLAIDGGMALLLLLLMGASLTGGGVHEWMGIALTLLIGLHLYYNRSWLKALGKGKWRWRRSIGTLINGLLLLSLIGLILASLPISSEVFGWYPWPATTMLPSQLHIAFACWFFLLAALHLGMQWSRVMPHLPQRLTTPTLPERLLGLALAGYGVWAFLARNIHEKVTLQASFDFARFDASWMAFLVDYTAIFFLFTLLGYRLLGRK